MVPRYVVIRSTGTKAAQDLSALEAERHPNPSWPKWEGAYRFHFYIERDGEIFNGLPTNQVGGSNYAYPKSSIGICMIGGAGNYTLEQYQALVGLIECLLVKHPSIAHVFGAFELERTDEPAFSIKDLLWNSTLVKEALPSLLTRMEPATS